MCEGDPTSVVLEGDGQPQCLVTTTRDCEFSIYDLDQVDFDWNMWNCKGTWAAPLWGCPTRWHGGGASGEIDFLENCPTSRVQTNFAGGGKQIHIKMADPDNFEGHTTMWKLPDSDGVMSLRVVTCHSDQVVDGACPYPSDGRLGEDIAYYRDIYGSNAVVMGNSKYFLVSDIWNGVQGNGGFSACAGGHTHRSTGCKTSVQNLRMKAKSDTFKGKCSAMMSPYPPAPAASMPAVTHTPMVGERNGSIVV